MSSESLFASLQRRVPLLAHPRQHAAPLALAGAAGLTLGAVGILLLGLPVWAAAALALALLAFPLALKWRADWQRWGAPLALLGMLLAVQGLRTAEHLAQWAQYHLLGWPLAKAGGLVAPLNPEVVQFVWAWAVLLLAAQLLRTRGRNVWMWLLLAWTALQTAELSYTFAHYLQTGVQQMPGILGRGGWLAGQADSLAPAAWLTEALPQLVATPRLDVQFWWSIGALLLLLPAAHTAARLLLSGEVPAAQAGVRPALAALRTRAAAPLALLRRANRRLGRAGLATAALVLAVVLSSLFQGLTPAFAAPGTVTGLVYQDYNGSGTQDQTTELGVAGITVTAYDATGAAVATATTAANGTYTLNVPVAGDPLRVEFTNLPAGYQPGPMGTGSGSKVQFVTATVANVNLGILRPADYCQNNPQLASECYFFGANSGLRVLRRFPYESGTTSQTVNTGVDTPANTQLSTDTQVGATWGLAYSRTNRQIYTAAFMKRHMAFGPGGPGAIYQVDRVTGASSVLVDLNTVFAGNPAGTDLHTPTNRPANAGEFPYFDDEGAWDAVGKSALAGLDLSEDDQFLWTVTLSNANRRLYRIPTTAPSAANIQSFTLPDPGTGATGCPVDPATQAGELNRNLRPGAVVVRGGLVYVGLTCTAESTQLRTDLRAFVYAFDTASSTYTQVANFPLTYPRGAATTNGAQNINLATWEPWVSAPNPGFPFGFGTTTVIPKYFATYQQHYYPQPWLSDIAFDERGAMIVALMDRFGHQSGNRNGAADSGPVEGVSAGDVLRLAPAGAAWAVENNATAAGGPTGGAGNNQGPGGGEFYFHDRYVISTATPTHNEITLGGLALRFGSGEVVATAFDPPPSNQNIGGAPAYRTGGLIWLSNSTGQRTRSYLLYYSDQARTFGKAAGIGDVELLCDAAPIEIGNRVWEDADRDGVQDPGEPVRAGVTVQLYDATGTTLIATTTTDANGVYLFKTATDANGVQSIVLPNTGYQIRIPALTTAGYALTLRDADASANGDERDSDASLSGTNAFINITTGGPGATNHSYDFGVYRSFSLGNRVWNDLNNNGLDDDGAGTGIDGATVSLYRDTNGSGVLDVGDTPAGTATTAGGGYYLFTGLPAGNYLVQLPGSNFGAGAPLESFVSSTGAQGSATGPYEAAPDPDNNIDRDDNGSTNSGGLTGAGLTGGIVSLPVTLGPTNTEPTGEGATPGIADATPDDQSNVTLDFGVFRPAGLGDFVWNDLDHDGVQDTGEPGFNNVTVRLYDATGTTLIATTTTNASGGYSFTNLLPNTNYVVRLDNPADYTGPLAGFRPTLPNVGGDDAVDSDATLPTPGSAIGAGNFPTIPATTGAGGSYTPTFDAGFFQPLSLGNRIWNDLNNDGLDNDGAGTGVGGVTLNLLDAGGAVLATTSTNAQGYYLFTDMLPGTYTVELAAANFTGTGALVGFTSSTGKWGNIPPFPYEPPAAESTNDGNDNGSVAGTLGAGGSIRSNPISLAAGTQPTGEGATPGIPDFAADANGNLTIDFGVYRPASLGDFVWNDLDHDGVQDAGEAGIPGVTVNLYDATGTTLIATVVTDANGNYTFANLQPGTNYVVRLDNPADYTGTGPLAGFLPTLPNAGGDDATDSDATLPTPGNPIGAGNFPAIPATTGAAGSNTPTFDAGLWQPLSLGNRIWNDLNNDGLDNDGAGTGVGGVTVNLLDAGGAVIATTSTTAQGYYLFTGLLPGTYAVELAAANFTGTGALVGFTSSTGTWGNIPPFPYEPGASGTADADDNGSVTGTLGAGGSIRSGPISLAVGGAPTGEPATPGITDPAADTNSNLTVDFGVIRPASLGDFVWNDLDHDGVQDAGEAGFAGVTVNLYDATGTTLIATVVTDANGNYTFANLQPGTNYVVRLDNPADYAPGGPLAGYGLTVSNTGGNDALDSDATLPTPGNPIGAGNFPTIPATTGAGGSYTPTFDAGFWASLSLGNRIWNDLNNNGLDDDGAGTGIGGVTVNLLDAGGAVIATTSTNAQGYYLFTDLLPGTYTVELAAANFTGAGALVGFTSSTGTWGNIAPFPYEPGAGGNTDADDNGSVNGTLGAGGSIRSGPISLAAGGAPTGEPATPGIPNPAADTNSNLTVDFGVIQPAGLGDFVWNDLDRDGVQDAGEVGIPGVTVNLYDTSGTLIATTVTDANGNYTFANLQPGTNYVIRLDNPADYTGTGPLAGFLPTLPNAGGNDATDSDATMPTPGNPIGAGNFPTIPATTGGAGSNTPTFDAGFFQPLSLGNRVWNDLNNNGLDDDGAGTGIGGVTVNLLDAGGAVLATTTTNAQGYYLFTGLAPGTYTVELPASNFTGAGVLVGFASSTGTNGSISGPFEPAPNTPADANDNGTLTGGAIRSGPISLTLGTQPTGEPPTPGITDPAADTNSNLTVDFGVFQPLSLGNQVWRDQNNNGVVDGGETGVAGVTVELRDAGTGTLIATTTTNADGYYLFTNLGAGSYVVVLPAANFTGAGPLVGFASSTGAVGSPTGPYEPGNSGPADNNDNGTLAGGAITSAPITLTPGTAPTGEPATPGITDPALDTNSDRTIDFGVFQPLSLGNRVWNDLNNNGLDDDGAGTGIGGVAVNLLDAGGAVIATTSTTAQGYYLFTGLPPGTYTVELPASNFTGAGALVGFSSSTGTWGTIPPFPYEPPTAESTTDGNDNGSFTGGAIRSNPITLALGTAPTGEPATPGIPDFAADANGNLTVDFGVYRPASLGDFVWNDLDRDGVQDAGEAGIPGVTVNLYDATGTTLIGTTVTDANGNYTFANLQPGTNYVIRLDNGADYTGTGPLAGFLPTLPNAGGNDATDSDATLPTPGNPIGAGNFPTIPATTGAAGSNTPTFDAGFFQPLSLGNRVWNDLNNNGLDDDGAGTGIGGVTVNLLDAGGAVIATTTTNAQGYYLFTGLGAGTYTVELPASNFTGTGALVGFSSSTGRWGNIPPFPYEPGAGGNTDADDNGTLAGGGIRSGAITLTAGGAPTGEPTTPGITDPALDTNSDRTIDFGVYRPASIGDRIWNDLDRDGVQDAGEAGIPGVTVNLYDTSGTLIATTVTDANGNYTFANLQPGTNYVIRLDNPADYTGTGPLAGFLPTLPNAGGNDATDSDATLPTPGNPIGTGNFPTIPATTGGAGSNTPTFDAGFFQPLSLGNRVWNDLNNNGLDDGGETGVAGVTVNLLDAGGAVIATTTTNAQGYYLFTGLAPGTYTVELPASNFTGTGTLVGFTSSSGTTGSASGPFEPAPNTPADNNDNGTLAGVAIRSGPITLAAGGAPTGEPATPGITDPALDTNSNLTVDFGVFQPLSLGNQVWNDQNNNGVVDGGETGITGVTVELRDAGTGSLIATTTTNAQGYYLFTNLGAGSYVVVLPAANFTGAGPLVGFASSTGAVGSPTGPYEPGNSGPADNNDNGTLTGGAISSAPITLAAGGAPTGEPATPGITDPASDTNSDRTIDFGVFQPLSLGNRVWNDLNNNGLDDDGAGTAIGGVAVNLLDAGGAVIATTTTNAQGYYLFTGLAPGTYTVELAASNFTGAGALVGFSSSTGKWGTIPPFPYEPPTAESTNDGNDNGTLTGGSIRSNPITLALGSAPTGEPATPGITDPSSDANSNLTVDFGVFRPASIGDRIWNDLDRDGVQDAGEAGIPGVTVNLYDGSGTLIASVLTDANGNYTFANLQPGTNYEVRLDNPADYTGTGPLAGFTLTLPNAGGDDTSDSDATLPTPGNPIGAGNFPTIPATTGAAGSNTPTFDAGFFQPLSLGNRVWNDLNNNGLDDGGETGVAGVTVNLLDAGGAVIATTTTNAQGYYLFTDLVPGTYTVELAAANFTGAGALVGFTSSTGRWGNIPPFPYEPGAGGTTDADDNGTLAGGGIRSGPITLTAGGAPTGEPATPGITNPSSDANSDLTVDFGVVRPASIGDRIWNDINHNGVQDAGEAGIPGVTVNLYNGSGTLIATIITDANGNYTFPNLQPGASYEIRLDNGADYTGTGPLAGFQPTLPNVGGDDGTDSDATLPTPGTPVGAGNFPTIPVVVGGAGSYTPTFDAGLWQPLSLGNQVWNDLNNNGLIDGSETGVAGVTVNLLDAGGAVIATTTTNAQGYYLFSNLLPGTYTVELPTSNFTGAGVLVGYNSSTGTAASVTGPYEPGDNGANDNNDNGTFAGGTVRSGPITLALGAAPTGELATPGLPDFASDPNSNQTIDFGVFQPLSLGNQVWHDQNNNGVVDGGETGIAGVTVNLLDASGTVIATTTTNAQGYFLFTNLGAGSYVVELPTSNFTGPLAGYTSSSGSVGSQTGPYEPGNSGANDNNDNGSLNGGGVRSDVIVLTPGGAPSGEAPVAGLPDPASDTNSNRTIDFGVFQPLSLGNRVWNDPNNNGLIDAGESGVANVAMQLLDAGGAVVATTQTNAQGYYLFTNLLPGTYSVRIAPSNFAVGGPLVDYISSTGNGGGSGATNPGPYEPGSGGGVDDNDNGTGTANLAISGITSAPATLALGGTPTGEPATPGLTDPAADINSDVTIDFGVFLNPTAIGLVSFTAVRDGSDVKLSWTTSVEVDTAGFYLYRSADRTRANAIRITPSLLAARGNGGGATYSWIDTAPLETGYYWLQEVEVEGAMQDYGPVSVQQPGGSRILLPIIRR